MLPYLFCLACLIIAYLSQRQSLKSQRRHDRTFEALLVLLVAANNLPEEYKTLELQTAIHRAHNIRRFNATHPEE